MSFLSSFFVTAITAIFLENAIFARALGLSKFTIYLSKPKAILHYGKFLTAVTTISCALSYCIDALMTDFSFYTYIKSVLFLICIILIYTATIIFIKQKKPKLTGLFVAGMVFSAFNCVPLGAMLIASAQKYSFWQTIGLGFGMGIGFTLSCLLVYFGRQRLAISNISRSFRGMPIILIYIGLISLAIYGLIGHQLPT